MPSQSGSNAGRRLLVAAGTAHFAKLVASDLLQVPDELKRIGVAFASLGYDQLPIVTDPDHDQLATLFDDVKEDSRAEDLLVVYYTGHGAKDDDRFYLLARDSDPKRLDRTALPAEDLARALTKGSKASQVLVIIDACYAGAGAADFAQIVSKLTNALGGGGPGIFVVAAARTKQEAEQGALSAALAQALANHDERLGGRAQQFLAMDGVMGAVHNYLRENHPAQVATWSAVNVQGACELFPNPRHRPEIRPGLDLETQRVFEEHWVPRARGAELGAGGWYFTGREQALRELAAWLREASSGGRARVVTGGPGCGKSALLARVVTLSNPTYRKEVLAAAGPMSLDPSTLPPEGVVSVAVHARRKLLAGVVAQIAEGLNFVARDPVELVEALASRPDKTVLVVDALDEADDKEQIVSRLLRPLAGLPQIFLLVGTRPDSSEHGQRFRALGESAVEIDLDAPRYIGADDVARYVERRLLATEEPRRETPYRASSAIAREVAQAVSVRAKNVFLVAHTAVLALLARPSMVDVKEPEWIDRLPTGLDDAFAQFLRELDTRKPGGLSSAMVRAVLLPLAFAEGEGLPWVDLWAAVATAVSGSPVDDGDITLVRKHAAAFIVEALEEDRSVYRLYHETVAEQLRRSVDAGQAQRRIVEALRSRVPVGPASQEPDWTRAHPYVLTHLASHAFKAGVLGELTADGMFIAAAEPLRTLQVLSKSTDPFALRAYAGYELAFHNLRERWAEDRLSYLEMAARQLGDDALAEVWTRLAGRRRWAVPWVRWSPVSPHRVIPVSHTPNSVALGTLEGRAVLVSGGEDETVRVWDLASGAPRGEPLRGHEGAVCSVALGTVEGRPVIVSGGDRTVRVWDLASGAPRGEPLRGHEGKVRSVALGMLEGRPVIVSGGEDETVRVWDLASGAPRGKPLRGHEGWVLSVALGTLEDRPVIVSGGFDRTVRLWDLASGAPRGEPLRGQEGPVMSVALGTVEDRPVIVSSGGWADGTMRVWDLASGAPRGEPLQAPWVFSVALATVEGRPVIVSCGDGTVRVWDLASGAPRGAPLRGQEGAGLSVALGTLEDRPVIVSAGGDGTVRVWDLALSAPRGAPLPGQESDVESVALGMLEDRPVIFSGWHNGTVRVWDLASGAPLGEPLRVREGPVHSVALGTLDNQPVIVSGAYDAVQVWDLASGAPRGEPLRHERNVRSVALGMLEGRPVIVSGGEDETVRVWDLASGVPRGEPLRGHEGAVCSVALGTLEGRPVIVSGGEDETVRVWDLASGAPRGEPLRGHEGEVRSVALGTLEDRPVIVSGGNEGAVRVWDLASGAPRGEPLRGHEGWVISVALGTLEDRPVIVSGGFDNTVRVWDTEDNACTTVHIGTFFIGLACAANGAVVVAGRAGLMALVFRS